MTWHDVARVRIKLKFPATQRHHREHAVHAGWLAFSQVRFLYGLPTYFNSAEPRSSSQMMVPKLHV